jgi:hypothetical protein
MHECACVPPALPWQLCAHVVELLLAQPLQQLLLFSGRPRTGRRRLGSGGRRCRDLLPASMHDQLHVSQQASTQPLKYQCKIMASLAPTCCAHSTTLLDASHVLQAHVHSSLRTGAPPAAPPYPPQQLRAAAAAPAAASLQPPPPPGTAPQPPPLLPRAAPQQPPPFPDAWRCS